MNDMTIPRMTSIDDVVLKCRKQEKNLYLKYYLSNNERLELIKEVGDAGCLLFEYYLRMASIKEPWVITDLDASHYFGWSLRKAQRSRQKLMQAGWFRSVRFTYSDGRKGITYYLGKEAVERSKINLQSP